MHITPKPPPNIPKDRGVKDGGMGKEGVQGAWGAGPQIRPQSLYFYIHYIVILQWE